MATKSLGMEGKTIPLYKVQLVRQPLSVVEEVKHAVPHSWEPSSLARKEKILGSTAKEYIHNLQAHHILQQKRQTNFQKADALFSRLNWLQDVVLDKPPIEELRYFLEFQLPRVWAPIRDEHPLHQRKEPVCPSLQFSLMGKKLYISQEQVSVGRKPITGLRLCLEGAKQDRLCIQLQHLASLPKILKPYWDAHITIAPVEHHEVLIGDASGVYIVTGAQLGVWDFGLKNVLYMKLLYSRVPGCTTRRSLWDHSPAAASSHPTVGPSNIMYLDPGGSGVGSSDAGKFVKIVDRSELCKGPDDMPGHWLVTGGKLGVEKGRIVLRVKYSLLNY
ncbi:unnamed protein product [Triticum turgidum subsp. durum]|uniref:Uncharacterized protein n=1 Tax=Triticum turgidum subsp. durum TaxID=4567 RepID=A0A9R0SE54_TRITD|nr:unnamed protein product [Triticum turgidum subsp. durum]